MNSAFNTKRIFKDNDHYNDKFGCIGDAYFCAVSILWTDKAIFEIKHKFEYFVQDTNENNARERFETRIFEINYCLKDIVFTYDYMNCLIRFIDASNSKHPEATIRDNVASMISSYTNAKNSVSYCTIREVECVRFCRMSPSFVETLLFCSYVYWKISYILHEDKDSLKNANYYLEELCVQSGLDKKFAKEHHLFKLYRTMLDTFFNEFCNNTTTTTFDSVNNADRETKDPEVIEETSVTYQHFRKLIFFNEKLFNTDERKQDLRNALLPIINDVQKRQDWYAVKRGAESVKERKDKLGRKYKVVADSPSNVAVFEDLYMLFPWLNEREKLFPINNLEETATHSSKFKGLRMALCGEQKRWTIKGKR